MVTPLTYHVNMIKLGEAGYPTYNFVPKFSLLPVLSLAPQGRVGENPGNAVASPKPGSRFPTSKQKRSHVKTNFVRYLGN